MCLQFLNHGRSAVPQPTESHRARVMTLHVDKVRTRIEFRVLLGNVAAHGVELSTTAEDAGDIPDSTNALIEYVFTFRDRFDQFKARRTVVVQPKPHFRTA